VSHNITPKKTRKNQIMISGVLGSGTHVIGLVEPVGEWTHCLIGYYSVSLGRRNPIGGCIERIIAGQDNEGEPPTGRRRIEIHIMCEKRRMKNIAGMSFSDILAQFPDGDLSIFWQARPSALRSSTLLGTHLKSQTSRQSPGSTPESIEIFIHIASFHQRLIKYADIISKS
jgi:hypothetical protein